MNFPISIPETLPVEEFQALVYERAGLCYRDLPWRHSPDPYRVWVSEIMLQQTQVVRVIPKYANWLERFPDVLTLARAEPAEVLKFWSGLGYNRRALSLHHAARDIVSRFSGQLPCEEKELLSLAGIGKYTARAILAFAYDIPSVFLETNIRTVFIKHFFAGMDSVSDSALEEIGRQYLDCQAPRRWYTALMDYGADIKKKEGNYSTKSRLYTRQSPFESSFRRVRGAVLKFLLDSGPATAQQVYMRLPFEYEKVAEALQVLVKEGFLRVSSFPSEHIDEEPQYSIP